MRTGGRWGGDARGRSGGGARRHGGRVKAAVVVGVLAVGALVFVAALATAAFFKQKTAYGITR